MSNITLKNTPRLKMTDLLRRRKMTLKQLMDGFGITTFSGLDNHCNRIGVVTPSQDDFELATKGKQVNNPTEGVVVIEPAPVIAEASGKPIKVAPVVALVAEPEVPLLNPIDAGDAMKKKRVKKEPDNTTVPSGSKGSEGN